ncbi:hypothetical protein XENOCAPTIV_016972 [Xenoophorus captivus]|uniref:Uncharacterized protein n=1 Tax=Xenoophorus captivus TaxID=1517983 RepID=A0ABV0S943_9TELE
MGCMVGGAAQWLAGMRRGRRGDAVARATVDYVYLCVDQHDQISQSNGNVLSSCERTVSIGYGFLWSPCSASPGFVYGTTRCLCTGIGRLRDTVADSGLVIPGHVHLLMERHEVHLVPGKRWWLDLMQRTARKPLEP